MGDAGGGFPVCVLRDNDPEFQISDLKSRIPRAAGTFPPPEGTFLGEKQVFVLVNERGQSRGRSPRRGHKTGL